MSARIPLAIALGAAAALGGCDYNLPESSAPPPAAAATVVTPTPGTTVITQAPATIPPTTVVIVPGSGTTVPPPRLAASEIDALFRGNTASGTTESGAPYFMRFDRSGTVSYREGSTFSSTGSWRVAPDGLLCTRFRNINGGIEDCYTVYRNASGTYTYERPDGHPVGSFTVSPG